MSIACHWLCAQWQWQTNPHQAAAASPGLGVYYLCIKRAVQKEAWGGSQIRLTPLRQAPTDVAPADVATRRDGVHRCSLLLQHCTLGAHTPLYTHLCSTVLRPPRAPLKHICKLTHTHTHTLDHAPTHPDEGATMIGRRCARLLPNKRLPSTGSINAGKAAPQHSSSCSSSGSSISTSGGSAAAITLDHSHASTIKRKRRGACCPAQAKQQVRTTTSTPATSKHIG